MEMLRASRGKGAPQHDICGVHSLHTSSIPAALGRVFLYCMKPGVWGIADIFLPDC